MIRLFVLDSLSPDGRILLSDAQHHYLLHVMRCRPGDTLALFNGRDGEWLATLDNLSKKEAIARLTRQTRPQPTPHRLILCPALIKKDPFDFVLQKATELNVSDIYPVRSRRTVVARFNADHAHTLLTEAAEQCERLTVPTLHPLQDLSDTLSALPAGTIPVCLGERTTTTVFPAEPHSYAFFIGPEGGWSPDELDLFTRAGAVFWHLGNTILRAETAAIAALSGAQFIFPGTLEPTPKTSL